MAKKKKNKSGETKGEAKIWPRSTNKQTREQIIKNRRQVGKRNRGRPGV